MNLEELLEELRENILHDRSDQIAGDSDQLWSDKTLIRYINQAERRMAREALLIRDNSSDVTKVTTQVSVKEYPLDDSIIAVISARSAGDIADLARAGHAAFDTYRIPDTYFFDPSSLSALPPGKVLAYDTDEAVGEADDGTMARMIFRTYPAPDSTHTGIINLRVCRMPINKLKNLRDVPEVPEDHHLDMLDWAAYLALRIVDLDEGAPARALEFRQSFEAHVKEARDIVMRKLFAPAPWGFGRNGWSWETN